MHKEAWVREERGTRDCLSIREHRNGSPGPGTPGTPPPPQLKMNGKKQQARTEAENIEEGQQEAPPMRYHTARETSLFIPSFSTLLFLNRLKHSLPFQHKNSSTPFWETESPFSPSSTPA